MIEQVLGQSQKLRQEQIMAPHQMQSLEILAAPLLELEKRINQEMESNPTLELVDDGLGRSLGNPTEECDAAPATDFTARDDDDSQRLRQQERMIDNLLQLREWNRGMPDRSPAFDNHDEDSEERRLHYWNSLVSQKSLDELLTEQLEQIEGLSEQELEIGREIIGSLDDAGYLRCHLADIATSCQHDLEEVEQTLAAVQMLEPAGIAARNLRECLLLQLARRQRQKSLAYRIVNRHLDELARNRLQQISRQLGVSIAAIKQAIEEIRELDPAPASRITPSDPTEFVAPEATVEIDQAGDLQVVANRDYSPRLRISQHYLDMLTDPSVSDEAKSYVREKLTASRQLINSLAQRESTIVRIARSLVKFQRAFFTEGIDRLQPLTMAEVAADLEVHETTVSRAVAGKYLMTPQGMLPFRFFFTSGYHHADSGARVSSQTIKQKLQELVSSEDRRSPLSDQRLREKLREQGFDLARRTIAKYREELGIQPSNLRKSF